MSDVEPLPIVEVTWRDASKSSGWIERTAALSIQPVTVHSIGFLLDRSDARWLLASAYIEGGTTVGAIEQVPRQLIVGVTCLKNCESFQSSTPEESPVQEARTPGTA